MTNNNPAMFEKFEEENSINQSIDISSKNINLDTNYKLDEKQDISVIVKEKVKQEITESLKNQAITRASNVILGSAKQEISQGIFNKFQTKLTFIRKYFDVDLEDILLKLKTSIIPFNKDFQLYAEKKPDLYGPFWIFATLVFIVAVAGNLSGYLNWNGETKFKYNFEFIPTSAGYIYGFGFGLPIILGLIMKYLNVEITLVLVICYYGYSFTSLGPMLILCVAPLNILKWIFLVYAIGYSTLFVLYNLWKDLIKLAEKSRYFLIGSIVVCQIILLFALKYHFFSVIS